MPRLCYPLNRSFLIQSSITPRLHLPEYSHLYFTLVVLLFTTQHSEPHDKVGLATLLYKFLFNLVGILTQNTQHIPPHPIVFNPALRILIKYFFFFCTKNPRLSRIFIELRFSVFIYKRIHTINLLRPCVSK